MSVLSDARPRRPSLTAWQPHPTCAWPPGPDDGRLTHSLYCTVCARPWAPGWPGTSPLTLRGHGITLWLGRTVKLSHYRLCRPNRRSVDPTFSPSTRTRTVTRRSRLVSSFDVTTRCPNTNANTKHEHERKHKPEPEPEPEPERMSVLDRWIPSGRPRADKRSLVLSLPAVNTQAQKTRFKHAATLTLSLSHAQARGPRAGARICMPRRPL
ncbi:hypothetical protein CALCODRAFT_14331 [Calocera cornea HHB12733]|uniref:Uncharacterized protein n=1 Tax=Calocera cornea HHB12733 TaxID=1353952 RepID=A0A165EAE6_9BASI|nr:hypothetical protein CALCODRAFT_14331 [Calocera cornea HHB12733]